MHKQQIKQLNQAKKLVNKARGEADQAQSIIRRSRGDAGLSKELSRAIETLKRTSLLIAQQCQRIERKAARTFIASDTGSPDGDCHVQVRIARNGVMHFTPIERAP